MEATVYLLMLHKYTNSKRKTLKDYAPCLGHISKDFTVYNIKKKFKRKCNFFLLIIILDTNDNLDIHRYLMKEA